MIKSILVCTDGSPYGNVACEHAIALAHGLKGHLTGLHVLDSRMLEGPLMADISGWIGAQPFGAQLQQFRELLQQKGEAIVTSFEDLCEKACVDAGSWLKMGHPARVILEEESKAEIVVLGQKGEHAEILGEMPGSTVDRVIRHSANPCLVTPETFQPVSRILAAFDGSGHAGKALHEAIELALALTVPLVILAVAEDLSVDKAREIAESGIQMARAHECAAAPLVVEGLASEVILAQAEELGCNLLVLGAHGHSRIREMILGSTTQQVVARAHVPVMLVR
jgi:nucleotide-binding universal stress UspA family protein